MTAGTSTAAQSLAAGLPSLLLAAERLAHTVSPGMHGRRRAGSGENFWQFRDFRDGDDPRRIDWRRSGGADRLFLREREWEAQAGISLTLIDHPGMAFSSSGKLPGKRERAALLLLALGCLLLRSGERVALAGITPPLSGNAALAKLATALVQGSASGRVHSDPKARLIAFGDFLAPDPVFRSVPGGAVMQVLDPAECDFPYTGRVIFEGFAGETEIEAASAQDWTTAYRNRIAAQREAVRLAAQLAGQTPLFHRTDAPPATALAALYMALAAP